MPSGKALTLFEEDNASKQSGSSHSRSLTLAESEAAQSSSAALRTKSSTRAVYCDKAFAEESGMTE